LEIPVYLPQPVAAHGNDRMMDEKPGCLTDQSRKLMPTEVLALPDEELARRAGQAGDNACFAELFVRYRRKVFFACRGFFSDSQAAEDATQETFLRAYRNIGYFHQGDFSGWLMRIAKNVCIDEWRRSRREIAIDDTTVAEMPSPNPLDSSFQARLIAERVWQEIRSLPSEQRWCLELKIEGFSYEETALRTGLSIKAVKSHLQNGRRMLWRKTVGAQGQFVKG
jgi:RNA polymerase sigma-70 factor (ECF subfamily)